ncbi:MAG: hypothetical protein COB36_10665 [Alphaproteobacteria bacterium]|nr:MAG: hypothetical protein COB36_10665 [Alphaproteobacteria bacterium]
MTLWETIAGNSSLDVSPTNTLWDHLNNIQAGSGLSQIFGMVSIDASASEVEAVCSANPISATVKTGKQTVSITDNNITATKAGSVNVRHKY